MKYMHYLLFSKSYELKDKCISLIKILKTITITTVTAFMSLDILKKEIPLTSLLLKKERKKPKKNQKKKYKKRY